MSDDTVDVIDMCLMQSDGNRFIQNVSVAPEKVIFLANLRQINDVNRFCTGSQQISILGIDPTYNLGPCFVTTSTYRHLQFLTKEKINPVIIGPLLLHMNEENSSYFHLPREMIRLQPSLTNIKVFGSDSEKNVYQPFRVLFPSFIHLLCDLHKKDNVKEKLGNSNFCQEEINIVMPDIFGKKVGEIVEKGLVDAQSIDEFEGIYKNLKTKWQIFGTKSDSIITFLENGKMNMMRDCMRGEVRSIAGLDFPPKPYLQNANECINSVIKRQTQKHTTIAAVIREKENHVKNQEKQIELSLLGQEEWEIAPEYQESTIQENSFYQMTPKQRQNFLKKFNSQNPKQKVNSEYMPLQMVIPSKRKKYLYLL